MVSDDREPSEALAKTNSTTTYALGTVSDGAGRFRCGSFRYTYINEYRDLSYPGDYCNNAGDINDIEYILENLQSVTWPCGPMDKASVYGTEDSRFDPWQGRLATRRFFSLSQADDACTSADSLNFRPCWNHEPRIIKDQRY